MQRITIFGREGCGFCVRAKELCEIKNLDYRYIDIHKENISKADLEKTVGKPVETVPQVFCGQEHIGGFTELEAFLNNAGV
ncbi:GrxA family glutaredoxin [Neptuniibacter pectenicola]|jgi:glutaredoxin 1|uniref:GrxA family glutaredoxin n=1 Tax=Neptuniibacter pectenicola TaxID=1806669 RepID=A0ABU9TQF4_9GAMM|nr:GrxA family glutaredoxin [Neptuniibacter pectenicola]KXJ50517.1 MAG: glutaredoxin [Neptuniibacter sp. Phe_28]|tara:strand:+ start:4256 stop:4498 length:243 start_codon:yes stop_codon:yes gene_type:complete